MPGVLDCAESCGHLRGRIRRCCLAPCGSDVGTLVTIISQLNTQPTCAPVNASLPALRPTTHDSGSGWFATPFLCDSFIHYSTPVYPGALRTLLNLLAEQTLLF